MSTPIVVVLGPLLYSPSLKGKEQGEGAKINGLGGQHLVIQFAYGIIKLVRGWRDRIVV